MQRHSGWSGQPRTVPEMAQRWHGRGVAYLNDVGAKAGLRCGIETVRPADGTRANFEVSAEPMPGWQGRPPGERYWIRWQVERAFGSHPDLSVIAEAVIGLSGYPDPDTSYGGAGYYRDIRAYPDRLYYKGKLDILTPDTSRDALDFGQVIGLELVPNGKSPVRVWPGLTTGA